MNMNFYVSFTEQTYQFFPYLGWIKIIAFGERWHRKRNEDINCEHFYHTYLGEPYVKDGEYKGGREPI